MLPALAFGLLACGEPPRPAPDVLLITVDTLRADRLGSYGYRLETSPNLDALAARGVRFEDCTVQWPKTWPSVASLLTGAYPKTTGLRNEPRILPEALTVLPEIFGAAGYRTGAVVANFNVGRAAGFQQGFEFFQESWQERWQEFAGRRPFSNQPALLKHFTNAGLVNEQALSWLRTIPGEERVFLWLHYMDPHGPYLPPEEYRTQFLSAHPVEIVRDKELPVYQLQRTAAGSYITDLGFYKAQYDREIRYLDDEIGRLLAALSELGRDDTLIVLTSDHGESLGEHDYYLEHGKLSYQPTAQVPAIMVYEGVVPAGRSVARPVGVIDLVPTLVELAGLDAPEQFEGESLVSLMAEAGAPGPEFVFMESGYDAERPQRTVREGRWKLIEVTSPGDRLAMTGARHELYDLAEDPRELANVASEHPAVVARLAAALARWASHRPGDLPLGEALDVEGLDEASKDMLRALGYVDPRGYEAGAKPGHEAGAKGSEDAPLEPLKGVVLVVLDTLRADRLSIAGYGRKTTPAIDALARRGVFFEQAVSGASWTLPAMIGLMTGRHPTEAVYRKERLQASAVEALREAGIHTAAFTEGGFASAYFGFDRGFDEHREFATKVKLVAEGAPEARARVGIADTFAAASAWLASAPDERFFLMVHTYEPHSPYRRRLYTETLEPGVLGPALEQADLNRIRTGELSLRERELAWVSALYDGGVSTSDRWVGRLAGQLEALGLADRVAVVVTSDHGEDLGDRDPQHAAEHAHSLHDEVLRVPLVVVDPRQRFPVTRVASQVRLMDVMPTVLDLLGAPALPAADGRSLLPLMRGEELGDRPAYGRVTRKGPKRVSIRKEGWKLIRRLDGEGPGEARLYHLAEDPGELRDLAAEEGERVAALQAELDLYLAELREEGALDFGQDREGLPESLREQLRALGYIE